MVGIAVAPPEADQFIWIVEKPAGLPAKALDTDPKPKNQTRTYSLHGKPLLICDNPTFCE